MINIKSATAYHLKAPLEQPYQTTFGAMTHRQAVMVQLDATDGLSGMAETYINFPIWAPAERMAAYEEGYFPKTVGRDIEDIPAFIAGLWNTFLRSALQSSSLGPAMQAIAAIEAALWDIAAKQKALPLRNLFKPDAANRVKLYGSGINPPLPFDIISECLDVGIDCFKLKIGYGEEADKKNIAELKKYLGNKARLAVDVNRSWTFEDTLSRLNYLEDQQIAWLEEPLLPEEEHLYPDLAARSKVLISCGENLIIPPGADLPSVVAGAPDILQPAIAKSCGLSTAVELVPLVEKSGREIYPHYLSGAPGLAASAQLASIARAQHVEWDINPNPMRTNFFSVPFTIKEGCLELTSQPGIGWQPDPTALTEWLVQKKTVSADRKS